LPADIQLLNGWFLVGSFTAVVLAAFLGRRCVTFVLTLRALALTPILTRCFAGWVSARHYDGDRFFAADGAPVLWVRRRREALERLANVHKARNSLSAAWGDAVHEGLSDLRFTDANRVPFPFARVMRDTFNLATVVTESSGPRLRDLDGHWNLDVSGSYGLNVAGFDRYKAWIEQGWELVKDLGPVLGPLHPVVAENVALLKRISGLDEVSFHMSGTEAVMAAVRLARFNTGRKLIVTFAGAYHGWWDGVMAGVGSDRRLADCLTLTDLDPRSLVVLRRRAREIAGVLVNPVQSFHPNAPPPNDAVLLTSTVRQTRDATDEYAAWLRELREICTACDIPLIFDEVYTGFRLAPRGAQAWFDVDADVVVYGKTVAGGMPIGVVCGTRELMRRFDAERPMRLAYVVGTFSAHPAVMGAMNVFLRWVTEPATEALYEEMNQKCTTWVCETNQALRGASLPLRVVHFGTIWTLLFKEPGRYNWLLQYYLRARGIILSWVGTGRCLVSMDFAEDDYDDLRAAILGAARDMRADGWWLTAEQHPGREQHMRARLMAEMVGSLVHVPRSLRSFYADVMQRKRDDHHASHNNAINQFLHLVSSSVFIYCYAALFFDLTAAMCLGLAALFVRQFGHAVLEPPCHEQERTLLGYSTPNKTMIFLGYLILPVVHLTGDGGFTPDAVTAALPEIAEQWWTWTWIVVLGRVVYLVWKHGLRASLVWYVKLVSDPLTDVVTYFPRRPQRA
jgi:glutamate-1-semialdehyde 2,1-aminomutase